MISRIFQALFGLQGTEAPVEVRRLPQIDPAASEEFIVWSEGLPQIDWLSASRWIGAQTDASLRADGPRAVTAAWLDKMRDAITTPTRRWSSSVVEGLAPVDGNTTARIEAASDRAVRVIGESLKQVRETTSIPDLALVAFAKSDDYYSFLAHFYPQRGRFATSGGIYIQVKHQGLPLIALPVTVTHAIESTIAHEMTHHALAAHKLPAWVEEGVAQMMEERVTGVEDYTISREMMARHRRRWSHKYASRFFHGKSFHVSFGDEQELAYHLAQGLVRAALATRPKEFLAYMHDCKKLGHERSMRDHLGVDESGFLARFLGDL